VVVIHEIFGLTDWCAGDGSTGGSGYIAIAPDLLTARPRVAAVRRNWAAATRCARRSSPCRRTRSRPTERGRGLRRHSAGLQRQGAVGGFCWAVRRRSVCDEYQEDQGRVSVLWFGPDNERHRAHRVPVTALWRQRCAGQLHDSQVDGIDEAGGQDYEPVTYEEPGTVHAAVRRRTAMRRIRRRARRVERWKEL